MDPAAGDAARGAGLFERHGCAGCHVAGREAPGVIVHPLAGLSRRHDRGSLAAFLATPTPPMPAAPLSPEDRLDLAAFLLSAAP